jgi:exodeoxyribonuclease VII large subunit
VPASPGLFDQPLGIRDLQRRVNVAIARELRGQVWVRAEINEISERNRHCFITLAEPARAADEGDAFLDVVIWRQQWARIVKHLDARGLALRKGMTVTLRGDLELRPGAGKLRLKCSALDTDALLGELAARRLALRRALAGEGLLEANRALALSPVPLRVGVVASPHSQGYRDFCDVLHASDFRFQLVEQPVLVQGIAAPSEVAGAVGALDARGVDVIVIVRGGGARADLDAFDSELVARAIASTRVPVWTGLGHTGDRCVADDVCHTSHATPTACAQGLVARVDAFDRDLCTRARRLQDVAGRLAGGSSEQLDVQRAALARSTVRQLDSHTAATAARAQRLQRCGPRAAGVAAVGLRASAGRLPRLAAGGLAAESDRILQRARHAARAASHELDRSEDRLALAAGRVAVTGGRRSSEAAGELEGRVRELRRSAARALVGRRQEVAGQRRMLSAFDPTRQLRRGWSLTFDEDGALVRRASALRPGQRITSRFVDGERTSVVEEAP